MKAQGIYINVSLRNYDLPQLIEEYSEHFNLSKADTIAEILRAYPKLIAYKQKVMEEEADHLGGYFLIPYKRIKPPTKTRSGLREQRGELMNIENRESYFSFGVESTRPVTDALFLCLLLRRVRRKETPTSKKSLPPRSTRIREIYLRSPIPSVISIPPTFSPTQNSESVAHLRNAMDSLLFKSLTVIAFISFLN
tara:strand:+ start:1035 stop:1619 length:585 start_codon:yes stop_codon:yes gene_type:complete